MGDGPIQKNAIARTKTISFLIVNHLQIPFQKKDELLPLELEMGQGSLFGLGQVGQEKGAEILVGPLFP